MKKRLIPLPGFCFLFILQFSFLVTGYSQSCNGLSASYTALESRCTATGSLQFNAKGGSGNYNYKIQGPDSSDFTSSSRISGLKPGIYSAFIRDVVSNCIIEIDNIVIAGTYKEPRFGISETDVTCVNGTNGKIFLSGLTDGRLPFIFTIVSPSASGIGTSNATGTFNGLIPGSYTIQLSDSCGAIQSRNISIQNYSWSITASTVTKVNCTDYRTQITLTDSKGNTNTSGTSFSGFSYGFVNGPADTTWFTTGSFDFNPAQKRNLTLVVKDNCGRVLTATWTNTLIPAIAATVTLSGNTCTGFNAAAGGQVNLTSPTFCLTTSLGKTVPGYPCNSTGTFNNLPFGSYCIKLTNTCYDTVINRCFTQAQPVPSVAGPVSLTNYTCTNVQAMVTGQLNLINPQYCLQTPAGASISGVPCNTTGIFTAVPYGNYRIHVTDGCTGMVFNLNFSAVKRIRSVAAAVTIDTYTCTSFNATITGQTNLTTPQYCLTTSAGNPITAFPCNSTGVFQNIPYGSYCINIKDGCNDTTIKRCFTVVKPDPTGGSYIITNKVCSGFTVTISGQQYIFNGQYCLQDTSGHIIAGVPCNNTGVFNNVPYGSYCVKALDGCAGKILFWCFTVTPPVPSVGPAVVTLATCSGFIGSITGQQNLTNPTYCLYNSKNVQVGVCNFSGSFAITGFGSYHIITTDGCKGAVFTTNFSASKPVASVGATVNFTNQSCTGFTATINGQTNLTNPKYYLKDNNGNAISNNSTGVFSNIPYGSYCISTINGCLDTTINRCFTLAADPNQITVTATPSCVFNASNIYVQVVKGFGPYTSAIYNSSNVLVTSASSANSLIIFTGLPALAAGSQYKIVVSAACGLPVTQFVTALPSSFLHVSTITPKCPSSILPNGSGDLLVHIVTNIGVPAVTIIRKNGVATSIGYSLKTGNDFTFSNLDAATYVIQYTLSGCTNITLDTVQMPNYSFPVLAPSGAYQCDNNTFSVGASVTGGIAPYNYQIIGSSPAVPSINSASQTNPVFTISNGVQYALVRLRAIDACGNATLNDVSILPLANTVVKATSNCIYQPTTLSVDPIPNATSIWYKKSNMSSKDSVLVGTNATYSIAAISVADTGIYVNRMSVNNGCLTRVSYFHLDGMCNGMFTLASGTLLSGKLLNETSTLLSWNSVPGNLISRYEVEKFNNSIQKYQLMDAVNATIPVPAFYNYSDLSAYPGDNYYRLKIINDNNQFVYSNIILLNSVTGNRINAFPNPVKDVLTVLFFSNEAQQYHIRLVNTLGAQVFATDRFISKDGSMVYQRDSRIMNGIYFLQIRDSNFLLVKLIKLQFE